MIIKGGSRAGADQLAKHLRRADTNERVELRELQWGHPDLREAFRDWQALAGGTHGSKGLYHANIDPAAEYEMTPAQWKRSVEVLEEELGLQGQPRAVVLHEKNGREHIHVVWARTDLDTMTLRSDSQNYAAHERASHRLEQEFGHEPVPGKHAKRAPDQQPEPPRAAVTQAEWQQSQRTGIDPRIRKARIKALFEQSDTAQAFKSALENAGYVLAKGDRRDFVIVDEGGEAYSLGAQIKGLLAAELRTFMAAIPRDALPSAAEAADIQQARTAPVAEPQAPQPEARPRPEPLPPEDEARLREKMAAHYATERAVLEARQAAEAAQMAAEEQAAQDQEGPATESDAPEAEEAERPALFVRLWQRLREILSPGSRRAREADEARRAAARATVRERARADRAADTRRHQAEARQSMQVRHNEERETLTESQSADLARRIEEETEARRIAQEIEQAQTQRELEQDREGPERGVTRAS